MTTTKDAPQSIDSERAMLGCILLDNAVAGQAAELETNDLFLPSHRVILSAMRNLLTAGTPVDLVTLFEYLLERGQVDQIGGGAAYLSGLTDGQPRLANVEHYVKTIADKARRRRAMQAGQTLLEQAQSNTSIEEVERAALQLLPAVQANSVSGASNGTHKQSVKESKALIIPDAAWCDLGRVYLDAVKDTTSASKNYHFATFLMIAGAVLGRSVHYRNGLLYPNLWMGLVGESSYAKKGTAMRYGKHLLRDVGMARVLWLMSVDSSSGFVKALAEHQAEGKYPDATCVLHFPELRSLIDKANREGSRDIIPKLSEAFDCEDLQRNVVGGSGKATNTFTALIGGAAPEWLENLSEGDLKGGIGNRFCWIPGETKPPLNEEELRDIDRLKWNQVVSSLHKMREHWAGKRDEKLATEMQMDPEAKKTMAAYEQELFSSTQGEPLIRELVGRIDGHCRKTAMIYAAIERRSVISVSDVRRALLFGEFLLRGLFEIFARYGLSDKMKQQQQITDAVRKAGEGGISRRVLQRKLSRMDAETFNRHLRWMVGNDGILSEISTGKSKYLFLNQE